MCGGTGFHDDLGRRLFREEALILGSRQTLLLDDAPRRIGDRNLEYRLG